MGVVGTQEVPALVIKALPCLCRCLENSLRPAVRAVLPCTQAVAHLRGKKVADTAKELCNLVSCESAAPSGKVEEWSQKDEVADLYSAFVSKVLIL